MNLVNCEIYLQSGQSVTLELEEEHANNVIANLVRNKSGRLSTPTAFELGNEAAGEITYVFNNVIGLRILPEPK